MQHPSTYTAGGGLLEGKNQDNTIKPSQEAAMNQYRPTVSMTVTNLW